MLSPAGIDYEFIEPHVKALGIEVPPALLPFRLLPEQSDNKTISRAVTTIHRGKNLLLLVLPEHISNHELTCHSKKEIT